MKPLRMTLLSLMAIVAIGLVACDSGVKVSGPDDGPPSFVPELPAGSGSFVFNASAGSRDRPVTVYYHRPANFTPSSPIVFSMHGNGRNATGSRNSMLAASNEKGFLLVVPEFSTAHYPNGSQYHRGNIMTSSGAPIDSAYWSFVTIEMIFDEVKRRTRSTREKYTIYGHSAGSQFVHRMLQMMPHARIEQAAIANAGWYTIPDVNVDWPYGLRGIPSKMNMQTRLREVFGRDVIVLLGTNDTSTTDPDLRKTAQAMAQGKHRFERGHYFYNRAKQIAELRGLPFNWRLVEVPGVAHNNSGMSRAAAKELDL